jgi:hypothetical protein
VQELLGHTDIRLTMRYAHLAPSATRSAVPVLDSLARSTSAPGGYGAVTCRCASAETKSEKWSG